MKIFKLFSNRKTTGFKVLKASNKVSKAFSMFYKAQKAILAANKELHVAVNQYEEEEASLRLALINKIDAKDQTAKQIQVNEKLAEKLSEFLL